jgi:hypothetical protein
MKVGAKVRSSSRCVENAARRRSLLEAPSRSSTLGWCVRLLNSSALIGPSMLGIASVWTPQGHHAGLRKPVSITHRTGRRHAETEIGKWRAETGAPKPPVQTSTSTRDSGAGGRIRTLGSRETACRAWLDRNGGAIGALYFIAEWTGLECKSLFGSSAGKSL